MTKSPNWCYRFLNHLFIQIFESHSYISQQLIYISCDFINIFLWWQIICNPYSQIFFDICFVYPLISHRICSSLSHSTTAHFQHFLALNSTSQSLLHLWILYTSFCKCSRSFCFLFFLIIWHHFQIDSYNYSLPLSYHLHRPRTSVGPILILEELHFSHYIILTSDLLLQSAPKNALNVVQTSWQNASLEIKNLWEIH